jgi:hypothetical protein
VTFILIRDANNWSIRAVCFNTASLRAPLLTSLALAPVMGSV